MAGMVEIERKILGLLRLLGTVLCNSKFYQSFRVGIFRKGSKMDYTITVAALTALVTSLASKGAEGPAHTINLMRILSTKILK